MNERESTRSNDARFAGSRQAHGANGETLAASDYIFEVNGRDFCVRVTCVAVLTLDGQLSPEEVELAARTYLEKCIENEWVPEDGTVQLDGNAMETVARQLGWLRRFRKLM